MAKQDYIYYKKISPKLGIKTILFFAFFVCLQATMAFHWVFRIIPQAMRVLCLRMYILHLACFILLFNLFGVILPQKNKLSIFYYE